MKKLVSLLLVSVMAVCMLTGCGDKKSDSKLQEIKDRGELIMATDAAWAPFEYIDADEKPVGSDIDLAQDIADALEKQEGIKVDKKKIELASPIKQTGDTEVTVKLFPEVSAKLKVTVTI